MSKALVNTKFLNFCLTKYNICRYSLGCKKIQKDNSSSKKPNRAWCFLYEKQQGANCSLESYESTKWHMNIYEKKHKNKGIGHNYEPMKNCQK